MILDQCKQKRRFTSFLFSLTILFAFATAILNPHKSFAEEYRDMCSSSFALPDGAKISERIFGLKGLSNVGRVSPGIYRGAQPKQEGYDTLKKMGIRTVINLRSKHSGRKIVEAAGMKSIEVPLTVYNDTDMKTINRIIDMMINPNNQPVYIHCKLGQDRTGIVIAAYRLRIDGWSLKNAEAEMQSFGFNDLWHDLKKFVRKYAKSIGK